MQLAEGSRHNKKRLLRDPRNFKQWGVLSACFGITKSGKFHDRPKQEGSKRPLGYVYPAAERPSVDCSVWWHFIFGVGVACLFLRKGVPEPRDRE